MHLDCLVREVDHVLEDAAMFDAQVHDGAYVTRRDDDLSLEERLLDVINARGARQLLRAGELLHRMVREVDVVVDRRARRNQVKAELAL